MPYTCVKSGNRWGIKNKQTGKIVGYSATKKM